MSCQREFRPEVSVVIAARNEAKYVRQAVESIVQQHGVLLELIFIDDHSDDDTKSIVEAIAADHDVVKVFTNPKKGKCSAFNYGVSLAKGRFICIFAGDDIMPQGSLSQRYQLVANEPDDICVVGLSKILSMSDIKKFDGHLVPRAQGRGALSGVSPMMNRMAADVIFPTPEILPNEDTWMELAVLHLPGWKIIHSDVVCCQWRVHSGNSINMTVPFEEFNRKITIRMEALHLFMKRYGAELDSVQKKDLQSKIAMENARRRGDWLGVLQSGGSMVDRLRALSSTNATIYGLRKRLYGLLSGW